MNTREEPQCFCQGGSQDWYAGSYWKFGITSKTNGVNGLARFSVPAKGRDGRDKVGYRFTMVAYVGSVEVPFSDEVRQGTERDGRHYFYWCCRGRGVFVSLQLDGNNTLHTNLNCKMVQRIHMM